MLKFTSATLSVVALLLAASFWGGVWSWAALLYISVFAYGVDRLSAAVMGNPDPSREFPSGDGLSALLALSHFVVLVVVLQALLTSDDALLNNLALFTAAALFAGQIGHPNAHELIHRNNRWLRRLGKAVYISILMGHHASAHPLVHHVHVATAQDPVSAPLGLGFWRFFPKAWIGSYRLGYAAESKRYAARSALAHPYVAYTLGALGVLVLAAWHFGLAGVLIWIALAAYAQLQIFLSDYVQHYGLRRRIGATGKPEPVGPEHSWNSPHRFSGAMMLNAPRHSDHHTHPLRPYPALQLDPQNMPILPYSLPMMAVIALMPPLWRRVMDRRVQGWQLGPET